MRGFQLVFTLDTSLTGEHPCSFERETFAKTSTITSHDYRHVCEQYFLFTFPSHAEDTVIRSACYLKCMYTNLVRVEHSVRLYILPSAEVYAILCGNFRRSRKFDALMSTTVHLVEGKLALVDPIGKRDRSKLDGPVGKLCVEKNIEFVPCTFLNSGGISVPSTIS